MYKASKRFTDGDSIYDENGSRITPLHDDYEYYKSEQDNLTNPLSDDYCKYDNE